MFSALSVHFTTVTLQFTGSHYAVTSLFRVDANGDMPLAFQYYNYSFPFIGSCCTLHFFYYSESFLYIVSLYYSFTASMISLSVSVVEGTAIAKYTPSYRLQFQSCFHILKKKLNSVALVRERTIPTERPPPVGEVSANFCG